MFRADGGPVSANRPYIVGEQGPELMIPHSSGTVLPNSQLAAGGKTVNIYLNQSIHAGTSLATALQYAADASRQFERAELNL